MKYSKEIGTHLANVLAEMVIQEEGDGAYWEKHPYHSTLTSHGFEPVSMNKAREQYQYSHPVSGHTVHVHGKHWSHYGASGTTKSSLQKRLKTGQ
jgi:hypothetical protein